MAHHTKSSITEELLKVQPLPKPNRLWITLKVFLDAAIKAEYKKVLKAGHYERALN